MTPDQYLRNILTREQVDTGLSSPVRSVATTVSPMLQRWGGKYLLSIEPSGSFAKGTCNRSGTDIDLFLSLSSTTPDSLGNVRATLRNQLVQSGYIIRDQNVSLGIQVGVYKVDLVPAKRQSAFGGDHSLYRSKASTWTKTNIQTHISTVTSSMRTEEIRIIKLWRNQKGLEFPSIYLELSVIRALHGARVGNISSNVLTVFEYLHSTFPSVRIVDPANSANVISDELGVSEKKNISTAAYNALNAANWNQIVV